MAPTVILEIAEQMQKVKPRNKVRFLWFAAEESGGGAAEVVAVDRSALALESKKESWRYRRLAGCEPPGFSARACEPPP